LKWYWTEFLCAFMEWKDAIGLASSLRESFRSLSKAIDIQVSVVKQAVSLRATL
jgi:hypothetical protein